MVEPTIKVIKDIQMVSEEKIQNSPFQRNISTQRVKQLKESISQIGFLIPLILVPVDETLRKDFNISPEIQFILVDGQHRFEAGKQLGMTEFPCVIAERKVLNFPTLLNIEKSDNLKDKAEKLYSFYIHVHDIFPDAEEQIALQGFDAYVIPIAFSYKEHNLSSPSLIEPFVKKAEISMPYQIPLEKSIEIRRQEAEKLKAIETAINIRAKELGIWDFNQKQYILSLSMKHLWGEARGSRTIITISDDFETAVKRLLDKIQTITL